MSKTLQELKQAALDIKRSTAPESITAPQLGQLLDDIIEYAYTADESAINELKETVQGLVEKTGRNVVVFVAETNEGSGLSYGLGGGSEALRVMGSGGIRTFTGRTGNVPALVIDGSLIQTGASPEQISAAIKKWLDEHPEATTTVADGSITLVKLSTELQNAIKEGGTAIDSMSGGFILSEVAAGLKLAFGLDLNKEDGTVITDWRDDIIIPFATHLKGGAMSSQRVIDLENAQQDIEEVLKPGLESAVQSAQNAERKAEDLSLNLTDIEKALDNYAGQEDKSVTDLRQDKKILSLERKVVTTQEGGFYLVGADGAVFVKYDAEGFDAAHISEHFKSLLGSISSKSIVVDVKQLYQQNPFGAEHNKYFVKASKMALKDVVPLIIVAGQSNAVGRAEYGTEPDWLVESGYGVDGFKTWSSSRKEFIKYDTRDANGGDNNKFGFDVFFAKKWIDTYGGELYCCKVAIGNTACAIIPNANASWNADIEAVKAAGVGISLCERFANYLADVREWAEQNGKVLLPLAILWLQGEGDRNDAQRGNYKDNLQSTFSFLRGVIGSNAFPIINSPIAYTTSSADSIRREINAIYTELNAVDENFKTIDISDFEIGVATETPTKEQSASADFNTRGWDYHFLVRGYERIGQRMFNLLKEFYL